MPEVTTWKDLLRPGDATSFFDRDPLPPFDSNLRAYSAGNAWWLAELSRLIYRHDIEEPPTPPGPARSSFLTKVGLRQLAFFNSERAGTQAFLVRSTGSAQFAALVFRGTEEDVRDTLHDLETLPIRVASNDVRVHEGFESALDAVWPAILRELEKLDCPFFYSGHSLGAALATLAASRCSPHAAYVFGSPRVGNELFAAKLESVALYRVVDDADVVTVLPPEAFGFRHAGELHRIGPQPEAPVGFDPLMWFRRLVGPPKPFADHAPINYVDRLR
jgi:triacylglycerol lipase